MRGGSWTIVGGCYCFRCVWSLVFISGYLEKRLEVLFGLYLDGFIFRVVEFVFCLVGSGEIEGFE